MSMPKISTRVVCVDGKIRDKKLDSESSSSFSQWKTVGGKKWEQDLQMRLFRCILWQILTSLAPSGRSLSTKTPLPSYLRFLITPKPVSGADLGGGCRGCAPPPPEMTCSFAIQLVFCKKKKEKETTWFIGVEVEQETSAPPPKKNPGSAPVYLNII